MIYDPGRTPLQRYAFTICRDQELRVGNAVLIGGCAEHMPADSAVIQCFHMGGNNSA
jgi:hypothetical protein